MARHSSHGARSRRQLASGRAVRNNSGNTASLKSIRQGPRLLQPLERRRIMFTRNRLFPLAPTPGGTVISIFFAVLPPPSLSTLEPQDPARQSRPRHLAGGGRHGVRIEKMELRRRVGVRGEKIYRRKSPGSGGVAKICTTRAGPSLWFVDVRPRALVLLTSPSSTTKPTAGCRSRRGHRSDPCPGRGWAPSRRAAPNGAWGPGGC